MNQYSTRADYWNQPPPQQPPSPKMDPYSDSDNNFGTMNDAFSEKRLRMGFIRKVYAILMLQLAITVSFICLFLYEPSTKQFVRERPSLLWIAFGITFVLMIVMACCENVRRSVPGNYICLLIFTICEGFVVGIIAGRYNEESVLMAVGICTVVCLVLTLFAFQTKYDFTTCSGFLCVILVVFIIFGIITIFFPGKIMRTIYASVGALIFSMYLVVDTQLMMGGKHKYSISPEEYIFASLNLYLDIIQLFLMILSLVGNRE